MGLDQRDIILEENEDTQEVLSEGDNPVEQYQQNFDLIMDTNLKANERSRDRYNNAVITTEQMREAEEVDSILRDDNTSGSIYLN